MNRLIRAGCFVASCCLLMGVPIAARADNWPNWRGPDNNGASKETGLATEWSETKNLAWKLKLPGKGGATPIVWKDRIFLTSGEGNDQVLMCIGTNGKPIWKEVIGAGGRNNIMRDEANEASASPCTDGNYVFAFVGSGNFVCYDFAGKEIWKFNVQDRYGKFSIQHGLHTTPLLHGDHLYLTLLHNNGHWIIALNKKDGSEHWKVERKSDAKGESREAYTSPCLWFDGKDTSLIVSGCDYATGHHLKDGKEIWRLGDLNPAKGYSTAARIIASPVASPEVLVVPTARGGIVVGLKPGPRGLIKAGDAAEQWRKKQGAPDVPTPLLHDGLVYLCRENGVLQCWNAMTGEQRFLGRLPDDRYRASPIFADGKIYLAARGGTFSVVKAGEKYDLLATNHLKDIFTASPAIANGRMYLRGFNHLYAIEEKGK